MSKRQDAHVKGELLTWARESINLDLEEAARKIGVKPARLQACEAGEARLTVNQLRKAAAAYKRPLAVFFLDAPPTDLGFSVPHDFRRLPGEPPQVLSPEFITALREAEYRRELAIELAEEIDEGPASIIGSIELGADPERIAEDVRSLLGVALPEQTHWRDRYAAVNAWKESVERLGVLVFHFTGVDVDEVRAFSISDTPFPVISVNGSDSANGRIFSLIHEVGHLLLNDGGSCDLREHPRVRSHNQAVEVYCNHLAGAVLVPRRDLQQQPAVRRATARTTWDDRQIGDLAGRYSVSREVLLRRLLILDWTSRAFYETKRREFREEYEARAERPRGFLKFPRRVVRSLGQPFLRIVLDAYYREDITTSDLAEYMNARLKHLPEIEALLASANVLTGGDG